MSKFQLSSHTCKIVYLSHIRPWRPLYPALDRWWSGGASSLEETLFYLWTTQRAWRRKWGNPRCHHHHHHHLHPPLDAFTDFFHHFYHLLQLIGTDVGTVGEPEVDEDPLAQEVLVSGGLLIVVDQWERAAQRRPADRSIPFFLDLCKVQQLLVIFFLSHIQVSSE